MGSETEKSQANAGPPERFTDPLGRPMFQGNPRFTDQQAGGDLRGDESDARDGNFTEGAGRRDSRDVSAHAEAIPAASAELLRCASTVDTTKEAPENVPPASPVEPDGTEDPGANADDGLMPGKSNGKPLPPD